MPSREKMPRRNLVTLLSTCIVGGAFLLARPLASAWAGDQAHPIDTFLSQDEEVLPTDENEVPPQQVEKYIKVYKAMQQNKTLTVEQATAQQGISLSEFRSLEDKIERNDALREHVRDALKPSAAPTP